MLIRSQDEKRIVNINTCKSIAIVLGYDKDLEIYNINADGIKLGDYSTEEKAIKVLDMIQYAYNAIETMKIDKCAWRDNHFFNMPSDKEVEV